MHIPWASPHDDEQQHSWARHCYCDIQARRALALRPRRVQCLSCRLECPHRMRIFFAHKYFQLLRVTVTIFTHNTGWQYCNLQQCLFLWNSSHHEWASKRAKMTENVKNQHWEFSQTPLERKKSTKAEICSSLSLFLSVANHAILRPQHNTGADAVDGLACHCGFASLERTEVSCSNYPQFPPAISLLFVGLYVCHRQQIKVKL